MLRFTKYIAVLGLAVAPLALHAGPAQKSCTSPFNKTSGLECISCGVEDYTGQVPSEKYLALLGFATQHYYDAKDPVVFQKHVIQQVQAYGFCLGVKLDKKGVPTTKAGYGSIDEKYHRISYPFINGSRSSEKDGEHSTGMNREDMKTFLKQLGIGRDETKRVFQDDRWQHSTPAERQQNFRQQLKDTGLYDIKGKGIFTSDETEGLADCIGQLKMLQNDDSSIFNFKQENEDNKNFCKAMANNCGIEDTNFCLGNVPKQTAPIPANSSGGEKKSFLDSVKRKKNSGAQ